MQPVQTKPGVWGPESEFLGRPGVWGWGIRAPRHLYHFLRCPTQHSQQVQATVWQAGRGE